MNVEELTDKREIERLNSLKTAILEEWSNGPFPELSSVIQTGSHDTDEIVDYIGGRRFDELPFGDPLFCTLTPLYYLSEPARAYYIAGYMIETINRGLQASENSWAGMDLPVVHALDVFLRRMDPTTESLAIGQKKCVEQFLRVLLRHPNFYFCIDVQDELIRCATAWAEAGKTV